MLLVKELVDEATCSVPGDLLTESTFQGKRYQTSFWSTGPMVPPVI